MCRRGYIYGYIYVYIYVLGVFDDDVVGVLCFKVLEAPPGSGKTLAYLSAILEVLQQSPLEAGVVDSPLRHRVEAIVVVPTRELVVQVVDVLSWLTLGVNMPCMGIMGGTSIKYQIEGFRRRKPRILVATPGRLVDLAITKGKIKLHNVRGVHMCLCMCMYVLFVRLCR